MGIKGSLSIWEAESRDIDLIRLTIGELFDRQCEAFAGKEAIVYNYPEIGLDLRLSGRGAVLVRGRRMLIVGSVCMDMITIDVTGLDVSPGDEVVLIGRQGDEEITAREMAAAIGAIPWEVICRLGARIERKYALT